MTALSSANHYSNLIARIKCKPKLYLSQQMNSQHQHQQIHSQEQLLIVENNSRTLTAYYEAGATVDGNTVNIIYLKISSGSTSFSVEHIEAHGNLGNVNYEGQLTRSSIDAILGAYTFATSNYGANSIDQVIN